MSDQNTNHHLNMALSTLTSLFDNNFECSICLDTFSDPHVIPECLHRFCGACVKESIRKCGAECPTCRARITTKRGLRKDNEFQDMVSDSHTVMLSVSQALECLLVVTPNVFPQQQMSMVLTAVDHLNQAKAEATDNERCAIKTETGIPGTGNEEGTNSSSIQKRVIMPRRSKRVPGLAEDPIQDNSSECHEEEDCELPVHTTDTFSERKRKSSAASSDASSTPKSRKKLKADKDKSTQSNTGFDEWCNQLIRFKEEFGHCNVPQRFANNPSLGSWCGQMRIAYKKIQKGIKADRNLSQGMIKRLEEIGFQWNGRS
jgi:hypothetical protein